jgi:tetratricopeptide (TPR) repeat protein
MSPRSESRPVHWAALVIVAILFTSGLQLFAFDQQGQSAAQSSKQPSQQSTPPSDQQSEHQAAAAPTPPIPPPLVSLTAGTPQDLERQGDQLRAQKRYLDAIDYYDAALKQQPTPLLWNKKGIALLFVQRNNDAKKCFENAVKMDKNSPEGLNNLGFVAQIEKRYNRAIKYYEKALEIRPNSPTFHYNLGAAYFSKHEYEKAATEYRTAYQIDPEIFQRVSKTGVMAQNTSPEDRAAFSYMVAKMYAQAGDVDHSIQYLRKAMEEGYKNIDKVYTDQEFATLRTDPRFTELMMQKPQSLP